MPTKNSSVLARGSHNNFNDRIYTPSSIVEDMLNWINPSGKILEPFKGAGAFYNALKDRQSTTKGIFITSVDWAEIEEGKDFFDVTKHYDYIITNPPYSIFTDILTKSFEIADNVILLIPHNKVFTSDKRLDMIERFGSFTYKRYPVPKEWSAKFPIGAYWFKKDKNNA